MSDNYFPVDCLNRRDFLRTIGGGAAAVTMANVLVGCGGGSGGKSGNAFSSVMIPATVNQNQIGGTGLRVLSQYKSSSVVAPNGSVTMPVAALGAQPQIIADSTGHVRAASISVGDTSGGTTPLKFDAVSTATALVFITPGILTVDLSQALTRIGQIQSLTSFAPLSNYLAQNLTSASLNSLRPQDSLDGMVATCIADWISQFGIGKIAGPRTNRIANAAQFSATWGAGPGSPYPIAVSNGALRFDSVVQQNLAVDGKTETSPPVALFFSAGSASQLTGVLNGPSPVGGWGNLLDAAATGAAVGAVDIELDENTAIVRLWSYGPGIGGLESTPSDVAAQFGEAIAWGQSALYYIVFPCMDVILGELALAGKGLRLAEAVWGQIQASINIGNVVTAAMSGFNATFWAVLLELLIAVLGLILTVLVLADIELPASVVAIGDFVTGISVLFGKANLAAVGKSWASIPASSSFDLQVSSTGVTVQ